MQQQWTRRTYSHKYYEKYYSVYGVNPPNRIDNIVQNWSNDLVMSFPHKVRNLGDGSDIGGPFHVVKRNYSDYSSLTGGPVKETVIQHPYGPGDGTRVTPLFAYRAGFNNSHFPIVEPTNLIELIALGSDAISKTAPNRSNFDGSTFVFELREGLPSIIPFAQSSKRRTARANSSGGEYLNVEFGWKPLLRDYHKFADSVKRSEAILDNYERNSGKLLRKRYTYPIDQKTETTTDVGLAAPLVDQTNLWAPGGYQGTLTTTTSSMTKRWFAGAFKYYLPPRGDPLRRTSELNRLYGTDITPNTLWNAAPWSWALDWVGNAGTLAKNLSLFQTDCLVMPWAYLMEEKSTKVEYQLSGLRLATKPDTPITLRQSFETVCKYRLPASPYGFDVDWPDLSGKQLAILAALGVDRAR